LEGFLAAVSLRTLALKYTISTSRHRNYPKQHCKYLKAEVVSVVLSRRTLSISLVGSNNKNPPTLSKNIVTTPKS